MSYNCPHCFVIIDSTFLPLCCCICASCVSSHHAKHISSSLLPKLEGSITQKQRADTPLTLLCRNIVCVMFLGTKKRLSPIPELRWSWWQCKMWTTANVVLLKRRQQHHNRRRLWYRICTFPPKHIMVHDLTGTETEGVGLVGWATSCDTDNRGLPQRSVFSEPHPQYRKKIQMSKYRCKSNGCVISA